MKKRFYTYNCLFFAGRTCEKNFFRIFHLHQAQIMNGSLSKRYTACARKKRKRRFFLHKQD
ncbi:hypothetical protein HMPREF1981_00800 [Bacteroides pyogenes F0041]|uniref:Uncharacterized protein n=1 Tax=Bacteroides pyogenes F0041 TaxID=1321819 RepID=U2C842_9BACE|nr:hypothetical protein HMPREF1981_00800 [Bacteroides pyogenes F0041]GAE23444.1 hypothetical protein JCM10003_3212 [Bacteroides pyogenes JCM 10003]